MVTYETFAEALEATGADDPEEARKMGYSICGLMDGETPRYFLQPVDVEEQTVADAAFQIMHGRPPSEYEQWLLGMARQFRGEADAG